MKGWTEAAFEDVCREVSGGNPKVPKSAYLESGALAVIDQGERFIGGYTNDIEAAFRGELPVIVFGDHTRRFKFVDAPFAMGADGIKVLVPASGVDARYLFRFLRQLEIPSAGYARHFKYLKGHCVPLPPLDEQRRFARVLDATDALRSRRLTSVSSLDRLRASVLKALMDLRSEGKQVAPFGELADVQGGLQVTRTRAGHERLVPYLRVANVHRGRLDLAEVKMLGVTDAEVRRCALETGDLLVVEGHGNADEIGRVATWDGSAPVCVHQNHLIRARCDKSRLLSVFAEAYLNSLAGRVHLLRAAKTTSGLNTITTSDVRSVPIALPSLARQREFAQSVRVMDAARVSAIKHLAHLDTLFASLQHRAFTGAL